MASGNASRGSISSMGESNGRVGGPAVAPSRAFPSSKVIAATVSSSNSKFKNKGATHGTGY